MDGINAGNTAWLLSASSMVLFMSVPGLALFYGGLVRSRNVLSTMLHVFSAFSIGLITWILFGFSIAFGSDLAGFIGNPVQYFALLPQLIQKTWPGTDVPFLLFAGFQGMFAAIAIAIIASAIAERGKLEAWLAFSFLWVLLVYSVIAHWVWGGGWLSSMDSLDFAGGLVVHISSGFSALVLSFVIGKRKFVKKVELIPHNIPLVLIGTGILWFGWLGFNAGSALAANLDAANAWLVTAVAAAAGGLAWTYLDRMENGIVSTVGFASGVVAGLVAITPAAGYVDVLGAIAIGALASVVSYNMVKFRIAKGWDETLDAWAVHGMSGVWGAVATGLFANPLVAGKSGLFFGNPFQLVIQVIGVIASVVYSIAVTYVIAILIEKTIGWRVPEEAEKLGLDLTELNEEAYNI
ncbi:ammonium transporter [Ignicoccus islandicus DSM 13165]|uniref:Ammonium transporter n=1 Tax=Ignicoccus islandicus DSM 13165 TaxID=940295 RepID=A0A0U2M9Z1_9CREN|nr:ammonium transporter [Ignicoccus islandicus]ALU11917.1 ammonium transporter [Ignicoccus islandicus DSM 13165]